MNNTEKMTAVAMPMGGELLIIEEVGKILREGIAAFRECEISRQQHHTERSRIKNRKMVAIKLIEAHRDTLIAAIEADMKTTVNYLDMVKGLLTQEVAATQPELTLEILKMVTEHCAGQNASSKIIPQINSISSTKLIEM